MTLNTQIRQTINMFRETLPEEITTLIERGAGEISALEIVEKALKEGDKIQEFSLNDHKGIQKSLSGYLVEGPLVLTFYRGLWCPYCNLQLAAYCKVLDQIKGLGANLVAVSAEGPEGGAVVAESNMPEEAKDFAVSDPGFDVLYDKGNLLAEKFGLAFELPESHKQVLVAMGIDVERANGDKSYVFADPATYIIGTDGIIKWAYVPNNYRKRAEPDTILLQLRALAQ
ncbi:MAG: peroxiredoxin-like family protein [Candidatus Caenarcaniphilales bacterium]|nr:peroxiredoxin-like family protein [Candidatus Caenarcaniphilales bacterium]